MSTGTRASSYEEAVAQHEWHVPERYNIAEDVCFKHPADKLAMIHEDFEGNVRERFDGLAARLRIGAHGVERRALAARAAAGGACARAYAYAY